MNPEGVGGGFARCVRHPSQFFTGFCSSCLAERLSSVDSVERSPERPPGPRAEVAEAAACDSRRNGGEIRERRTLLSLFQLDDCNDSNVSNCSEKSSSLSSDSVLPVRGLRWRLGACSKSGRFAGKSEKHSCDWRVCRESHDDGSYRGVMERPRHSWDGSVMGKALACSFACLEEPQEGSSRIKRRLPEETGAADVSKADDQLSNPSANLGSLLKERRNEELRKEIGVADCSKRKSRRWSRVWDWSITSPFRDFGKRKEHNLERSLSGTCQERQKDKSEANISSNGSNVPRANQGISRNANTGTSQIQKFRPDWQRKRENKFGRSRSVHYPSPGNVDNGLLRFYLTPMRTSRRTSSSARMRSSLFFPKGILGH